MSAANSAAKKRRAPQEQATSIPQQQQPQQSQNGLTLPQVISLIDQRLIKLESNGHQESSNEDIEEFEKKFEILADEISSLKEIVLSLQSYTMAVNKILFDEKKLVTKGTSVSTEKL